jgi:hypothetical protein
VADVAALSPLPGSPKRKLREYASLHRKPFHIPSARASGFQERDRQTPKTGNSLPEPSAIALLAIGGAALGGRGWRRRRQARPVSGPAPQ